MSKLLSLIIVLLIVLCGCKTIETEDYWYTYETYDAKEIIPRMDDFGFFDTHPLVKMSSFIGISGSLGGSLFLGSGSFKGDINSVGYVIYACRFTNDRLFFHILPLSLIDIKLDPEISEPIIRYQYRLAYFDGKVSYSRPLGKLITAQSVRKATITISEEQLAEREYLLWQE